MHTHTHTHTCSARNVHTVHVQCNDTWLFEQARRSRLWSRLRRVTPLAGRLRRALLLLFEEVHYRPCHEGAKRCRASFEGMVDGKILVKRARPA